MHRPGGMRKQSHSRSRARAQAASRYYRNQLVAARSVRAAIVSDACATHATSAVNVVNASTSPLRLQTRIRKSTLEAAMTI